MSNTPERGEERVAAEYARIVRMLAAVECDYDRLTELRELKREAEKCGNDAGGGDDDPVISGKELEELAELEDAAGDCTDKGEARQRIREDPLSVEMRSDWTTVEVRSDWTTVDGPLDATEFRILIYTGGPEVRIVGELGYGEPVRARLEYRDWGAPWTHYPVLPDILCKYASHFFFWRMKP